jgi:glycerol-3-phosphate dehydrogenase
MKRSLSNFTETIFDIVIIGGGITGACLAADAAMRGLTIALVEKGDFGAATSSASSKLLHGGIRYLQQLNFSKVRESANERVYFQNLAPHLTNYIPFIIPTYKNFSKGSLITKSAMGLYEFLCSGQDRILRDPSKKVPASYSISEHDIKKAVPGLHSDNITGGVVFFESHMHSPERMTLGFLETAHQQGASVANYVEVESLLGADKGCVRGIQVKDRLSGDRFEIQASLVVNAAGPWIPLLNQNINRTKNIAGIVNAFSKGTHIITRQLTHGHAVALPTQKRNQAVINRSGRHVFIIPWRGHSLIGTTYGPYQGELDSVHITEDDIEEMISDINSAMGTDVLHRNQVLHGYAGIYPLIDDVIKPNVYQGTGHFQIVDHSLADNLEGLVSVLGAKFTTARLLAEKTLDLITPRFDKILDQCKTRSSRLVSGDIDDMQSFRVEQCERYGSILTKPVIRNLITNYGTNIHNIIKLIEANPSLAEQLTEDRYTLAAEVIYSVRQEMAFHLNDVIFRRTGLGTLGNPGEDVLRRCAIMMGQELGWDDNRKYKEVTRTLDRFQTDEQ